MHLMIFNHLMSLQKHLHVCYLHCMQNKRENGVLLVAVLYGNLYTVIYKVIAKVIGMVINMANINFRWREEEYAKS